jgi:hypothetical protein
MSALQRIQQLKAETDKLIKTEGESALKEEFARLFAAHPEIGAIRWQQYTPYFNDGDPCSFSVGEFEFQFAEDAEFDPKAYYYNDGIDEDSPWESWVSGSRHDNCPAVEAVSSLECLMDEDILEAVFGDHVEIVASREGFEVEEYDHD